MLYIRKDHTSFLVYHLLNHLSVFFNKSIIVDHFGINIFDKCILQIRHYPKILKRPDLNVIVLKVEKGGFTQRHARLFLKD